MINALTPNAVVRFITALVMIAALGGLFFHSPAAAGELWAVHGGAIAFVNAVIFALTYRPVFLWAYRVIAGERWWFPMLDGRWTGEVRSNWPRVRQLLLAARGEADRFNALTDDLPASEEEISVLNATIECSLFSISMVLDIPDTDRTSRTIFVRPEWRRPYPPRIAYVYEQVDHGQVAPTDAQNHRGAAVLTFHKETGELRGEYWTDRQAARGLNTAGTVIFRRADVSL